jgi:hypothetical protein
LPVLFDSSTAKQSTVSGGSGSVSNTHVVNTLANDLVAVVAAIWNGGANTSSGTWSATFGGEAMAASDPLFWNTSNYARFQAFTLQGPPTGSQTFSVSVSGMPTGTTSLTIVSATYSGVAAVGDIVSAGGASASTTTTNSVTVNSGTPANRVVTIHAASSLGPGYDFSNYSLVQRAEKFLIDSYLFGFASYGAILLGDGPGATTVTGSVTQNNTANWGAFGIPLSPSIVKGDSSLNVTMSMASGGHLYRVGTPAPQRTWVIES